MLRLDASSTAVRRAHLTPAQREVKKAATQELFDAARRFLAPVMNARPVALSFEMRDIDPDLSPKTGTIRDHLET